MTHEDGHVIRDRVAKRVTENMPCRLLAVVPHGQGGPKVFDLNNGGLVEQSVQASQPHHLGLRSCGHGAQQTGVLGREYRVDFLPQLTRAFVAAHLCHVSSEVGSKEQVRHHQISELLAGQAASLGQ